MMYNIKLPEPVSCLKMIFKKHNLLKCTKTTEITDICHRRKDSVLCQCLVIHHYSYSVSKKKKLKCCLS